jgi:tRNA dimethylallyltransferase
MAKEKIIVVLGPTSSGKSDLAVALAKKYNGEVISADSRQVYIGMNLGTGKITKKEMANIPHHLLDVANPKVSPDSPNGFTVAKYQKLAFEAIKKILAKGKLPIICGGTGLYIQTLVDNLIIPEVKPNQKLRKELEKKSITELASILKKLDTRRWREIDKNNPRRLIRAIEIATELGKVPKLGPNPNPNYQFIQIGLNPGPKILRARIHARLLKRLRSGMIGEVRRLHEQGVSWKKLENFGLEYRYIAYFLQNKMNKSEMLEKLEYEINQYAKRQMTWFKRDTRIHWFTSQQKALAGVEKLLTY